MAEGMESLDNDFRAFMNELVADTFRAASETMEDAKEVLKKHIVNDVYAEEIYDPKVYKRRSKNRSLGTPLSDVDTYSSVIPPAGGNVGGQLVVTSRLYYNPKGSHKVKRWDTASDDDLIGRIEKKDPPYTWGNDEVPPRPFWQNFISEMVDDGEIERAFARSMNGKNEIKADGAVIADDADRHY